MSEDYLKGLNPIQHKAVTHIDGPVLVIAGPGSGKTRVLTIRIAHLIKSGIPAWEILALTFTNKAAKEMKERISKVAGDKANQIWAGTFHSIFARILRSEATKIGFPSDFSIYDPSDVKSCITEIVKGQGMDTKAYAANDIYRRISMAKNNLISPQAYATDADRILEDKQANMPYVYKIYDLYMKKLQRSGAMDFDDLLYQMHRLLKENPENVLEKYRKKFKYVMVDEFQDTNSLQNGIIQLLVHYPGSPQNICVVGDDAQSIYAFRGATIQNILDFEKEYPNLTVYKLEQNYRSTSYIVQAANDVISHNSRQIRKKIFTEKGEGEPIRIIRSVTDNEEARMVASMITEMKMRHHLKNEDIAILYRINAQSRIFEESLKGQRIAYRIFGGVSFYERKEIKDVISYLRVIANPKDEEALKRVVNYPTRGIGNTSLDKLALAAEQNSIPLWEVLRHAKQYDNSITARAANSIKEFVMLIETFQRWLTTEDAYEMAKKVVKMTGIIEDLEKDKTPEGQGRIENVQELLDGIKSFVEEDTVGELQSDIQDKSLSSYLQNIALVTDSDKDEDDNDRVKLMSVHSAKGLEFKAVFITGMEENLFPSLMALKARDSRAAIDEERRLFYVAITRAEQFLVLSYASSRYRFGKMQYNNSSRFLEEISPECMDIKNIEGRSKVSGMKLTKAPLGMGKASGKPSAQPAIVVKPSPAHLIVSGAKVLHERFGEGKVIAVEGDPSNKIATIFFGGEIGEKRIMLKFAKLQLL
jgi:DNA helicase II / ATP-dependent DNA helicase PcrA